MTKLLAALALIVGNLIVVPAYAKDPFSQGDKILKAGTKSGLMLVRINPVTGEEKVFETDVKLEDLNPTNSSTDKEAVRKTVLETTLASLDPGSKSVEKYAGKDRTKSLYSKADDAPTQAWYWGGYGWWNPGLYYWGYSVTVTYTYYYSNYYSGYDWGWYRPTNRRYY